MAKEDHAIRVEGMEGIPIRLRHLAHVESGDHGDQIFIDLPKQKVAPLSVRFDALTIERLTDLAEKRGIPSSTLVRMWVIERLSQEAPMGDNIYIRRQVNLPES